MLMGACRGPPAPAPRHGTKLNVGTTGVIALMLLIFSSSSSSSSWVLLASGAPPVDTTTTTTTTQALLRFKSSLAYVNVFDTWHPSVAPSPCAGNYATWRGVLCSNGVVWGLQLENLRLTGQIDVDALVPLRSLRTISLMNNSFEGPMPEWKKLGALKSLFLSNNHFSGQIPPDAFNGMASLKKVYLANNRFTGNIPATLATPRLLELRLENNQFTGPIPDLKPGIKALNVSNNQLQGSIPSSLAKMDPSSFAGNKGVCGPPLAISCNSPSPLPDRKPSPTSAPSADSADPAPPQVTGEKASSVSRTVIVALAILVALVGIAVLLAIYRRSKKETPRLGKAVTSPSSSEKHSKSNGSNGGSKGMTQAGAPEPYNKQTAAAAGAADNQMASVGGNAVTSRKAKAEASKLSFVREDRQKFDLQDLLRASAEVLGSGNFGSSYKAVLMDGQAVVVKRFKQMSNVGKEDFHEHMRRLGRLVHPNLLPLVAYYYRKEEKLLVFDYMQNGNLASHLHGNHSAEQPALDWPTRLKIVKGVARGLAYLHHELPSVSLAHGHLKSSNVVLDKTFQPLLMDYALVPVVNPEQVQHLLVAYKSPEYVQHGRTTRKTDVWNLGVLILEILTSNFPANYIAQGTGVSSSSYSYKSSEVAGWINSIKAAEDHQQEAGHQAYFDREMGDTDNSAGEMWKLLRIGVGCCEEDAETRWDLKEAVEKIEDVKERDGMEFDG
ncbi:pollen receptor-like kinase 1 [Coffea eugenioides]|uniref:pollen receptor-like kinase 1 n=1 Tax=Coffea eugenioides TaxID=49369 RepID=UPI000F60E4E9|nr:pollen receptor-like kinase 1 [Coffea eugenioides]